MGYLKSVGAIILLVAIAIQSQAVDYCAIDCGKKHIACNNNGNFAKACKKPSVVNVNSALVLKTFNEKRNEVAGGTKKFNSAARMATMKWDDELAAMALLNAKRCVMAHDHCHGTAKYKYSGQNVASMFYSGNVSRYSDDELLTDRMSAWLEEENNMNKQQAAKLDGAKLQSIGHFTLIITDRNTHVGCGAVRSRRGKFNKYWIACNFASENFFGYEVYKAGKVAEACETGIDETYKNLCSTKEVYPEI